MNFAAIPIPLLFVLTLAANLTAAILQTRFARRTGGGMAALFLYTAASTAVGALAVFLLSGCRLQFSLFTTGLAFLFGMVVCLQQLTLLLALSRGPLSYTTVIVSLSTLITALSGVLFWQETLKPLQFLGIALMILCLILSVKKEPVKQEKETGKRALSGWLVLSLLSMALNGGVGILQKTHQSSVHREELPAFLVVAFVVSAVFSGFCCLFFTIRARRENKEPRSGENAVRLPRCSSRLMVIFLIAGVCVALCHCINLYLSGVVAAAVFFPIVNGGALMLTTLASLIFFRERLGVPQWLGLASGAAATLLLCL